MKYLSFIRHSEKYREMPPPSALMEAMGELVERSMKEGTLVDTGGLLPSKDGMRVRLANGKITAILKAETKAEFLNLHRKHWPGFEGECEVRPMFEPGMGC